MSNIFRGIILVPLHLLHHLLLKALLKVIVNHVVVIAVAHIYFTNLSLRSLENLVQEISARVLLFRWNAEMVTWQKVSSHWARFVVIAPKSRRRQGLKVAFDIMVLNVKIRTSWGQG